MTIEVEGKQYRIVVPLHCPHCESLQREVDTQEEQIRSYQIRVDRMVEALRWYANEGRYYNTGMTTPMEDKGKRARIALETCRTPSIRDLAHKHGLEVQENHIELIDLETGKREEP